MTLQSLSYSTVRVAATVPYVSARSSDVHQQSKNVSCEKADVACCVRFQSVRKSNSRIQGKVGGIMAQLKVDLLTDSVEPGKAQVHNTGEAAGTETAANALLSDGQLDELFQQLKTLTAGKPELRNCLVSQMLLAEEAIERLIATGLARPSVAATSTERQDNTQIPRPHTIFADPREGVGYLWAKQNGYAHVNRLGEKEAREVLSVLKPADDMYSDAWGDLVLYDNPWCWLEPYANAGGDLQKLNIKQDFDAPPFWG